MGGKPLALGVLASGRGSNLSAILKAITGGEMQAEVTVVVSDNPAAPALNIATQNGIPNFSLERKQFATKEDFEKSLATTLQEHNVELVALAGYMRLVGPTMLKSFPNKIINIHPSLLPSFPGLAAQEQALNYGVKISGCTVHYVNEIMDGGRIIAQVAVPVLETDTTETLSERILVEEHQLFPKVISQLVSSYPRNYLNN